MNVLMVQKDNHMPGLVCFGHQEPPQPRPRPWGKKWQVIWSLHLLKGICFIFQLVGLKRNRFLYWKYFFILSWGLHQMEAGWFFVEFGLWEP